MLNTIIIANFIGLRNVITDKIRVKTNFLKACFLISGSKGIRSANCVCYARQK